MLKVAVTGSAGKTGRFVVEEFNLQNYHAYGIDIKEVIKSSAKGDINSIRADLRNLSETIEAFEGVDAIVHLANIALPGSRPATDTFIENITINYNVIRAANILGITKLVWLSSIAVVSDFFDPAKDMIVPIDSNTLNWSSSSSYSLSKIVTEFFSSYVVGENSSIVGLRTPLIEDPIDYLEYPKYHRDPKARQWHMWSYIDARDVAIACRLAIEASPKGVSNFFISASDTVMDCPIEELYSIRFPDKVPPKELIDLGSFISNKTAEQKIGFKPCYSWRNYV